MNLQDYFDKGLPYEEFRERVEQNLEVLDEVYQEPNLMPSDLRFFESLAPLNILAVGEDWCPDVVHTLPRWARLEEQVEGISFRISFKKEVPDLMEQHLGPGNKERIPLYLFLDPQGNRIAHWGHGGNELASHCSGSRQRRICGDRSKNPAPPHDAPGGAGGVGRSLTEKNQKP